MRTRDVFSMVLAVAVCVPAFGGTTIPDTLPDPSGDPPAKDAPVKVYILSGQSNMVGMGEISGGFHRAGKEIVDPVVSVYAGDYAADTDYDELKPVKTVKLEKYGGVHPTPFPDGGTRIVRGHVRVPATGVYEFKPGYGPSTCNIMVIDGREVYRKEPGEKHAERTGIRLEGGKNYPFTITFLTEAANGLLWLGRTDVPGTLHTLVRERGTFPHLVDDDGRWTVRNDVIYKGVISATGQGPLAPGIQGGTIGPELQFGHVMGYYHDGPVLIIKASIGNRSLGWDILPPGSERYTINGRVYAGYKDSPSSWEEGTEPKPINWYAGKTYDRYVENIHAVLDNFDTLFPRFKDQGWEVAGFVWWQGHKDGGSEGHISRYERNLANLITAWRTEFTAPDAPWAIATVGFGGRDMPEKYVRILEAQMAVADPQKHPAFAGTVATVDIRDFWRSKEVSPRAQGYHYNRNAETYLLVGDALGRAMVKLKERGK